MDWARDLPTWPLNAQSRRIAHRPHQWHVQEMGEGPVLLLLHGAGASTHSWRAMIPRLSERFRVVALDLPGQGFTRAGTRNRSGLGPTAEDIASLCAHEGWQPVAIAGHSAGAAIALALAERLAPAPALICLNAALDRFDGVAGWLFPMLAKVLALNPFTAMAFTMGGNPVARARRLIESTGSTLDDEGLALYGRLLSDRPHVEGTLQMMAQWNVDALARRLGTIPAPTLFLTGARDRAVAPSISARAALSMPHAQHVDLPGLGHLAHEEAPKETSALMLDWLAKET
ncbi:MAG: alpha/beta fold hydrolase [Roseovarius sp.]